jgi:hypothetical protein
MWQFLLFPILSGKYILPRFGMVNFTQHLLNLNGDFPHHEIKDDIMGKCNKQKDNEKV